MEHTIKIADYLTNRLSKEASEEVRLQIANDSEWAEEAVFLKEVLFSAIEVKKNQLRTHLDTLEVKLQENETTNLTVYFKKAKTVIQEHIDYSIEHLKALFAPVPHYQPLLAMPIRAGNIEVLVPKNGVDCSDEGLYFELSETSDEILELSIENNQCEEVYSQEIEADAVQFTVPFAAKDYSPGRYYWKLMVEDEMVISEFFVGKNLKPLK